MDTEQQIVHFILVKQIFGGLEAWYNSILSWEVKAKGIMGTGGRKISVNLLSCVILYGWNICTRIINPIPKHMTKDGEIATAANIHEEKI